ncbi:MAG: ABC transporter substrate-binding protein [Planctomycetales bacterium]
MIAGLSPGAPAAPANENHADPLRIYCCPPLSNYPPFYSWPEGADRPTGHGVDLALAKKLGRSIEFVGLPLDTNLQQPRIDILQRDRADLVVSCFTINAKREKQVAFSEPYFADGLGILVRADSKLNSLADSPDSTVIAWRHTTAYNWAIENLPAATIISEWPKGFTGNPEVILINQMAGACITNKTQLTSIAERNKELRVLPTLFKKEQWGVAARKDAEQLLQAVNVALQIMKKNGRLKSIRNTWMGSASSSESKADGKSKRRSGRCHKRKRGR